MRDLLSDGIIGIRAGFWAGRLCAQRRFGCYGKFRNGRRHFQYVRRQSENRIARSISISADIDTGAGAP